MENTGRPRELEQGKMHAFYLDLPTIRALRREAMARRCSMSQLVRELVREHLTGTREEAQDEHASK